MPELNEEKWLSFILSICQINAKEESYIINANFPILKEIKDISTGKQLAYEHIAQYVEDRLRLLKEKNK